MAGEKDFITNMAIAGAALAFVFIFLILLPASVVYKDKFFTLWDLAIASAKTTTKNFLAKSWKKLLLLIPIFFLLHLFIFSLVYAFISQAENPDAIIDITVQGFIYVSIIAAIIPWAESQLPGNRAFRTVFVAALWATGTIVLNIYKTNTQIYGVGSLNFVVSAPLLIFVAVVMLLCWVTSRTALETIGLYIVALERKAQPAEPEESKGRR